VVCDRAGAAAGGEAYAGSDIESAPVRRARIFRPSVNGFLQDVDNRHVSGVAPFFMVGQKSRACSLCPSKWLRF
jgi:hypothetical protein